MRKILLFTRFGLSAIISASIKATAVALAVGSIITAGASQSQAQYPIQYSASAAAAYGGRPNTNSVLGSSVMKLGDTTVTAGTRSAVVDSAFRGSPYNANVKPASYVIDQAYAALDEAECYTGYGPNFGENIGCYFFAEGLLFRRAGEKRFSLTQNVFMNNYDFEFGGRFTLGKMCDSANAYEFVYAGPFAWEKSSIVTGTGTINSLFFADPPTLNDAFNGADRHVQILQSDLNSFEMNQRVWAWDAVSTLIGIRYLKYEENFQLTSLRSVAPVIGNYREEINNDLLGLQIGGDLFFPTSLKTTVSMKGKIGAFANFAGRELRLRDSDGTALINGDDNVDFSGLIEIGGNGSYELTPSIRLTGGVGAWYLYRVATESGQVPYYLNNGSGRRMDTTDDVLFYGLTFGAQILY